MSIRDFIASSGNGADIQIVKVTTTAGLRNVLFGVFDTDPTVQDQTELYEFIKGINDSVKLPAPLNANNPNHRVAINRIFHPENDN